MRKSGFTAIAAAMALASGAGAMTAQGMTKDEYKASRSSIAAEYKSASARCGLLSANAKDVCMAEAKGKERVDKAELEALRKPNKHTRYAVSLARAETDYAVAREKCDDKAGKDKSACVKAAKTAEARAIADAGAPMQSPAAKP